MPLLRINLLFLLLPLSLCCRSTPDAVQKSYMATLQTDLSNTIESVNTWLINQTCHRQRRNLTKCHSTSSQDVVSTLYNLTCDMKGLNVSLTERLVAAVLNSLQCSCDQKPTRKPTVSRTGSVTRRKRDGKKLDKKNGERRKKHHCIAKEILSNMTRCYEILNSLTSTTPRASLS